MSLGPVQATEQACSKSELDVFQPVNVQVALTDGRWHSFQPVQAITNPPDLAEFVIPGTANEAIDMNNISVYIKAKITQADGKTALATTSKVAVCNNLLGAMFRHIDVSVNGQLLTRASRDFAYKDYLTRLLYYSMPNGGKEGTQGACFGWIPNDPADKAHQAVEGNLGWLARKNAYATANTSFELQGPVGLDLFNCDRMMMPGMDLHLKFHFNQAKFIGFCPTAGSGDSNEFALVIEKMELIVRKVTVGDSFVNEMTKQLQTQDAILPFVRREITSFSIATGESGITRENLFRGQLATRYFVCLVESAAFNGTSWVDDPFCFKDYGLNEVAIMENDQTIAGQPIKVNFANKETTRAYYQLLETLGGVGERALIPAIRKDQFDTTCAIFGFTRSPDLCHGDVALPTQIGNVTCRLTFGSATSKALTCIVMAEFDSRIQINKDKNVVTDYAV